MTTTTASPGSAIVHLMSQFRMERALEPVPAKTINFEKLSITETQDFLAKNGLEK